LQIGIFIILSFTILIDYIENVTTPIGVAINPLTSLGYVSNIDSNTVSIIDGTKNRVINFIRIPAKSPFDVTNNYDNNLIDV
jgi:YVTN family beta-propeller protein